MGKKSDKKDDNMGRSLTSLIENYKVAVCGGGGVGLLLFFSNSTKPFF